MRIDAPRWLVPAALLTLITLIFLSASLMRAGEALSRGYQYSRPGISHFNISLLLGYGLSQCGEYSYSLPVIGLQQLYELKNDQSFSQNPVGCDEAKPAFAPENGQSILIGALLSLGMDTPYKIGVAQTVVKYALILISGLIATQLFGRLLSIAATIGISWWAYREEAYFLLNQLMLSLHVLEPYVWLLSLCICALALARIVKSQAYGWRDWLLLSLAVISMFYLRLYRSSDFYLQEAALVVCTPFLVWSLYRQGRKVAHPALMMLALIVLPMLIGTAHLEWIERRTCASIGGTPETCANTLVNVEHPVLHPVVLGLAVPPSPISERFGFAWKSDSETLIPARFINPAVDKLYTPEHAKALRDFYVYIWTNYTAETVQTYLNKISVVWGFGWFAVAFGFACIGLAILLKDVIALLFALAYMGKLAESVMIYPIYWSQYHQSSGVLTALMLAALLHRLAELRVWEWAARQRLATAS